MIYSVDFGHVPLPVVLSGERLATCPRVVTALDGAVELLFLLVAVVYVSLQMRLCAEALAASRVGTFVVFTVVSLVMSAGRSVLVAGILGQKRRGRFLEKTTYLSL